MVDRLQGVLGVIVLITIAWLSSERRQRVSWRFIGAGLMLQVILTALLLELPWTRTLFGAINRGVLAVQSASEAGSRFVFGFLGGGPAPYLASGAGSDIVLAFRILPLIIVVSALAALLTHWRILPAIVQGLARMLERLLGIGGAVALCAVANPFLGMVESSILVRPYIVRLSRSELCMVMCTGLATIAGTVLILYATFLADVIPDAGGHLVAASLMSLPAALVIAHVLVPEDRAPTPATLERAHEVHGNFDAITRGTQQGLELFLNIVAVLLVFVALVHLCDGLLGMLPPIAGAPVSLERLMGIVFAPVAWLIGIPWQEATTVGALLGTKTVLNELIAYHDFAALSPQALSPHSKLIVTYALCGFANVGSVGILVTGLSTMAPSRRRDVASLGLRSLLGGTLATCITAAIVGAMS